MIKDESKTDNENELEAIEAIEAIQEVEIPAYTKRMPIDETIKKSFGVDKMVLVRFINNIFRKKYNESSAKVKFLRDEFVSDDFAILRADFVFSIDDDYYHIEFQTEYDGRMIIRIFEYGLLRAEDALADAAPRPFEIELAQPIVIQIDESSKSEDWMEAVIRISGTSKKLKFKVPVVNVWKIEAGAKLKPGWILLSPFILLKYRKLLKLKKNEEHIENFKRDWVIINDNIAQALEKGEISNALAGTLFRVVRTFVDIINERFLKDELIEREVESYMLAKRDVFDQVLEEVAQKERKEERLKMVREMLKSRVADEQIIKFTGVSSNEINHEKSLLGLK